MDNKINSLGWRFILLQYVTSVLIVANAAFSTLNFLEGKQLLGIINLTVSCLLILSVVFNTQRAFYKGWLSGVKFERIQRESYGKVHSY